MNFSEEEKALLRQHVSNLDSNIYLIHNLPPEVIAVLFAYVSRSPNTFRENLLKLIQEKELDMGTLIKCYSTEGTEISKAQEKAAKFHERWVVGYGHSSVAEHACASVAIEDVSIIATKVIEDNRLASFTEKSTRYQQFDKSRYIRPRRVMDSDLGGLYTRTMDHLFDSYAEVVAGLLPFVKEKYPRKDEAEKLYDSISRARAFDIARYLLPAGTLTNLGMTGNARMYEHAITKLLSSDLEELEEIGQKLKTEIKKTIPTLVKYADRNEYAAGVEMAVKESFSSGGNMGLKQDAKEDLRQVCLVDYDVKAEEKLVASILYRFSSETYQETSARVKQMGLGEKEDVLSRYLSGMGRHDYPLRELEHIYYTFDILVDYGAYRDIQRHRMCTQTTQDLDVSKGYSMPPEIVEAGFRESYVASMDKARDAFIQLSKEFPKEAQYVIPLAYKKRTLFTWNLRELYHFIRLRSGREGHISYREVAWDCYDEIKKVHPGLAKWLKVDTSEGPSR